MKDLPMLTKNGLKSGTLSSIMRSESRPAFSSKLKFLYKRIELLWLKSMLIRQKASYKAGSSEVYRRPKEECCISVNRIENA